jgi:hypothetical protein
VVCRRLFGHASQCGSGEALQSGQNRFQLAVALGGGLVQGCGFRAELYVDRLAVDLIGPFEVGAVTFRRIAMAGAPGLAALHHPFGDGALQKVIQLQKLPLELLEALGVGAPGHGWRGFTPGHAVFPGRPVSYYHNTVRISVTLTFLLEERFLSSGACVFDSMGLVVTPLETPRRFHVAVQPLETPQNLGGRELVWRFDGGDITSDGGVLALQKLEQRTGIVRRFAACFEDYRNPNYIEHPLMDLILQRVFGLALGYEDLNDHDELRRDPMLAVALNKDDVKGEHRRREQDRGKALAGKSTLNRLELTAPDYDGSSRRKQSNRPETKKIVMDPESIDALLVDLFVEAHTPVPEQIILDVDATDDKLFGKQEGRFYHGYYRDYCYLPLYVFCGEHLLCARLRRSNIDASADSVEELEPVVARIRQSWPSVNICLRGDSGFCREKLMAWCEREGIDYVFGLAQNSRLKQQIQAQMQQAEQQHRETKAPARVFTQFFYSTLDTWNRQRRVVAKAEHLDKGANPRFVVTSLSEEQMPMQQLYEKLYCGRGESENRIKEQQLDLFADRTSTGQMWANQVRLYFSSIAYVLLQTLRRIGLAGTEWEHAQCGTIRLKLLKIGAQVRVTVRKVWVSLSGSYPYAALFARVLAQIEAG